MPTHRLTYLVPAEHEEAAVTALWERGTLGVQVLGGAEPGTVRLEAYFEGEPPGELPIGRFLGSEEVPPADWLAAYREAARPFPVGERLLLDPRDPEALHSLDDRPAEPGRFTLRIPARGAFGTGSHESTRLALELLEGMDLAGRRVLDVGTGTGVLAFAALLFGARGAVGLDLDPAAPFHARANARLNRLRLPLLAGGIAALRACEEISARREGAGTAARSAVVGAPLARRGDAGVAGPTSRSRNAARGDAGAPAVGPEISSQAPCPAARFDLALVNVVPEEIAADLPGVVALLVPGGEAVLSGILSASGPRVLAEVAALGLTPVAEGIAEEWVAYRVRKWVP